MRFRDPVYRARFERDGFVVVDLLTPEEVRSLRAQWHAADDPIQRMPFNVTIMSADRVYRRHIHQAVRGIVAPHQQRLLEDARFCFGSLVAKPPSADGEGLVPLHQDPSFIDESRADTYNFWIALQDVSLSDGCLWVVRGSHILNRHPRSNGAFFAFPYPELRTSIESYATAIPLRSGQAIVTYQTLFHQSFSNAGQNVRLAASALAVPQDASLRHYYQPFGCWTEDLEVFNVDDDFYIEQTMNERPSNLRAIGYVPWRREDLSPEHLRTVLGNAESHAVLG
jgi:hypothetical protein